MSVGVSNEIFLEALFSDALPGTHTIVCSFPGDPHRVGRRAWAGRPWRPGDKLPYGFRGGNTYVTVSTFEADPNTGEQRRRKANFVALHAVMVDDVGTKVASSRLMLPPSVVVETSPANFQVCYFLRQDGPTRDCARCEQLIERMIAVGLTTDGKDPGMKGVTRYARLPVGINAKARYVEQLGRPFVVRCAEFEPQRRYALTDIADAWRLDLAPERPKFAPKVVPLTPHLAQRAGERFAAVLSVFRQLDKYLGQRDTIHDVVCPWVAEHTDRSISGTALFEPSAENGWRGGFHCHHGHCDHRTMADIRAWLRALGRLAEERIAREDSRP